MYYNMIPESKGQKSDAGLLEDFIERKKICSIAKIKKVIIFRSLDLDVCALSEAELETIFKRQMIR